MVDIPELQKLLERREYKWRPPLRPILFGYERYAIITHMHPDEDAIGCAIALRTLIMHKHNGGLEALIIASDARIRWKGLKDESRWIVGSIPKEWKGKPYLAVVVDTHTPKRLTHGGRNAYMGASRCIVIDHHQNVDTKEFGALKKTGKESPHFFIEPECQSCGEYLYYLIERNKWGLAGNLCPVSTTALAGSIFSETNCMSQADKSSWWALASLIQRGANMVDIINPDDFRYLARTKYVMQVLSSYKRECGGRIAILSTNAKERMDTVPPFLRKYVKIAKPPIDILAFIRREKYKTCANMVAYILLYDDMKEANKSIHVVVELIKPSDDISEALSKLGYPLCKKGQYRFYKSVSFKDLAEEIEKLKASLCPTL